MDEAYGPAKVACEEAVLGPGTTPCLSPGPA